MRSRSLVAMSLSCLMLVGGSAAVSAQDDPQQVLAQALQATSTATSFHFLVTADGTVNLGEAMGNTPLDITGTKAEGDVSVTPLGVQLTFDVPLGGLALSGALLYPNDGSLYVKLVLPMASSDDLWHKVPMGNLPLDLGGASPAPAADMAAQIQAALTESGAVLTDEGETACASGTCTKLHLEVPSAALTDNLGSVLPGASVAPDAPAAAPIPVDILIDTATNRIDSLSTQVTDAATGTNLIIAIALSGYDVPVTITAPPADQVSDAPLM
jgi:hypothetical protein